MPNTMKALVYTGTNQIGIEERPIPVPTPDEVLIQVKRVSICGSDFGAYRHSTERFAPPLVLGHEFSGVIAETGRNVKHLQTGQRVSVNPILYCGECYYCRRGLNNLCGNRKSLGTAIGGSRTDGAMRQFMPMRARNILPLADAVSFLDGALLEPLAVCLACAKCGAKPDDENVVVLGMGPIGLMIVKFLKAMGIKNVYVSDIMPLRLEKAKSYGASQTLNASETDVTARVKELTGGIGADRVIIAAGVGSSIQQSFDMVRNGGTVVLVALMHEKVEFEPMQVVARGISFLGSYMFTNEMAEAMRLIADGKIEFGDLVTSTFTLEDGKRAFDTLLVLNNPEIKVQISVNE